MSGPPRLCICVFLSLHYMHTILTLVRQVPTESKGFWQRPCNSASVFDHQVLSSVLSPIEYPFQSTESLHRVFSADPSERWDDSQGAITELISGGGRAKEYCSMAIPAML